MLIDIDSAVAQASRGIALLAAVTAIGPWASPNAGLSSTRAATGTALDARTIPRLHAVWRFPLDVKHGSQFGAVTSNPIIAGETVYVQDSSSSVLALDLHSGALRWRHAFA
ncbi:MAG: hypothetical protein ACXVYM_08600, partial [Gaiellaceae bacterium]